MFDKIHTISDMLLEYAATEEKSSNPTAITNKHSNMEEIPSKKPLAKPASILRRKYEKSITPAKDITADNLSTQTIIELKTNDGQRKNILGLLDTGAISSVSAFIKRDALTSVPHIIKRVNGKIQGRYASESAKEVAMFDIKLPELCRSKTVSISAYIEENAKGRHDLVLGS
eukprot:14708130-Ditylum_brightwellii.AAC.1